MPRHASADTRIFVTLSQTGGGLADGMVGSYAEGSIAAPLETQSVPPGSYWVHTSISPKALCEASFTAGGANLAHEPLVLGIAGTAAPLVLALRDDCGRLDALASWISRTRRGRRALFTRCMQSPISIQLKM